MNVSELDDWALSVLEVYNFAKDSTYSYWYDFIRLNLQNIPGDLLEIGVYRGRTLCATASLLRDLHPELRLFGFDSFSGFPPKPHPNDSFELFQDMHSSGLISDEHFKRIQLNSNLLEIIGRNTNSHSSSSSGNFSGTSRQLVEAKLDFLSLTNTVLVEGDIAETMNADNLPDNIAAIFLDADLYLPYKTTLEHAFPRLSPGGFIFLDEYYSLKFPGPRIAVNEFVASTPNASLTCIQRSPSQFERWILVKS